MRFTPAICVFLQRPLMAALARWLLREVVLPGLIEILVRTLAG
jgi:hypothetical protein